MFLVSKDGIASARSVTPQGRVSNLLTRLQPRKLEQNKGAVREMLSGVRLTVWSENTVTAFICSSKARELIRKAEGSL